MKNKTVIITGAAKGIGAAISELFAQNGYNTVICYNSSDTAANKLQNRINSNGGSSMAIKVNVTDRSQINNMVSEVLNTFGSIDVLINNAGVSQLKMFCDITDEDWDYIFETDLKGVYRVTQSVLPTLVKNKSGKIINISSMWGIIGASCEVHYSAAKAGVIGLTKSLAKELGPSNITVNCIAPGIIDTDMNSNLSDDDKKTFCNDLPISRMGKPEEIAKAALFLASESANYITGQTLSVDGGMTI